MPYGRRRGYDHPRGSAAPVVAPSGFSVDGADFDGTNDFATRGAGLTGVTDSKLGLICFWMRLDGSVGNMDILRGVGIRGRLFRASSGVLQLAFTSTTGSAALGISTVGTFSANAAWKWIAASWDMTDTAKRHLYVGDTSDLSVVVYNDLLLDYTEADYGFGASTAGANKLNGCLAEFFFFPGVYLDLSVQANRRLFFGADGKPVDPAAAIVTLGSPAIYMHLDDGETANNFVSNDGTGGAFTVTGSLDTASTSPAD